MWGLVGLLAAGVAFTVATAAFFGIYFLADDFRFAGGDHAAAIASTARAIGFLGYTAWAAGASLAGAGVLPMGVLMVRTGEFPTKLGIWAIAGGAAMLLGWSVVVPTPEDFDYLRRAGYYITAAGGTATLAFFLALAGWLLFSGSPAPSHR